MVNRSSTARWTWGTRKPIRDENRRRTWIAPSSHRVPATSRSPASPQCHRLDQVADAMLPSYGRTFIVHAGSRRRNEPEAGGTRRRCGDPWAYESPGLPPTAPSARWCSRVPARRRSGVRATTMWPCRGTPGSPASTRSGDAWNLNGLSGTTEYPHRDMGQRRPSPRLPGSATGDVDQGWTDQARGARRRPSRIENDRAGTATDGLEARVVPPSPSPFAGRSTLTIAGKQR